VQPRLWTLLMPKWRSALTRANQDRTDSKVRMLLLAFVGLFFWVTVFGIAFRVLRYLRSVDEIGNLMAGKVLDVILLAFLSILLLSNIITALSTFFLAKDLDLLIASPVSGVRLYLSKLA
jgi:ABC-2 type transport system permease protein